MARLRSSLLGLFVIGALLGTACGDDPAPPSGKSNTDDEDDEDTTSKKDAGKPKDAGKATDAGKKDGGAAAATVECGSKTCTGTTLMQFSSKPCCFDEEEELCSVFPVTGGDVCPAPAMVNENCPSVTILGQMPKPCCTADNHCGIDATMLGMGCADLGSPGLAMLPVTLPPPQTCDGELLEPATPAPVDAGKPATTGDAGKTDAGAATTTDAGKADAGRVDAGR